MLEALVIERGQQRPAIAVAQPSLAPRGRAKLRQHRLYQPPRAVAAAREPDRVERIAFADLDQGGGARRIVAGEVARRGKALRVEEQLRRAVRIERGRQRPARAQEPRARGAEDGAMMAMRIRLLSPLPPQ